MKKRSRKKQSDWESSSWWARTPLSYFEPLTHFASQEIDEANWKEPIWQALGREKFCDVVYKTKKGSLQKRMWAADVMSEVSTDIGLGWFFAAEHEERIIRTVKGAITELKPVVPKIFGEEATLKLAKRLRGKVKQILDSIVAKTHAVERQREGKEGIVWIERSKERDVVFRLTGHPSDYTSLPWHFTHFAEHEEINRMIRNEFGMPDTRHAMIHSTGFLCFDDEGEDAARTLAWMLIGLADVIFNREKAILKKCLSCEKHFFHLTARPKKFCSDHCRYNHHNDY